MEDLARTAVVFLFDRKNDGNSLLDIEDVFIFQSSGGVDFFFAVVAVEIENVNLME